MKTKLTYDEAVLLSLTAPWKVSLCNRGESCWCRIIEPVEEIKDKDDEQISISNGGSICAAHAEYIVKLHNQSLTNGYSMDEVS